MKNKKSLGQHWLKNRAILEEIAELAWGGVVADQGVDTGVGAQAGARGIADLTEVGRAKTCVEIGPGLGTLTSSLLKRFEKVIAIEYDADLAHKLPGQFPGKNLEVVNEDFLKYDLAEVGGSYVVAGNIPYYITSPIIEKVLTAKVQPERVVLLMQREVAERIVSERGSVLALMVENYAEATLGPVVPAAEFTPPPKVDSRVLVLEPHAPRVSAEVLKFIKLGFGMPRKKLLNNLAGVKSVDDLRKIFLMSNINVDARPADLKLADFEKLYQKIYK